MRMLSFALAVAVMPALCAMAQREETARGSLLQIQSAPSDATVWINGELRGNTPLTLTDLPPGEHLLSLARSNHRTHNQTVTLAPEARRWIEVELEPLTGLVLVHSDPPEAEVILDGATRGHTPLLLSELPFGSYRLQLTRPGYQPRAMDLNVKDRTPRKISLKLPSNSATLSVTSTPAKAEVTINGIPQGATPLTVPGVPANDAARVIVSAAGYEPFEQTLRLTPGEVQSLAITLKALPSTLAVVSEPPGARVSVNDRLRGITPLNIDDLAPGEYTVRLELRGHDPETRDLVIERGKARREIFIMDSNTGRIILTTEPAGVTVLLDDLPLGETEAPEQGSDRISNPFTIEGVAVGAHALRLVCRGFFDRDLDAVVERGKTVTLHAELARRFIPDYEVTTDRRVYRGVLDSITEEAIRLETAPGITETIERKDVRNHGPWRE